MGFCRIFVDFGKKIYDSVTGIGAELKRTQEKLAATQNKLEEVTDLRDEDTLAYCMQEQAYAWQSAVRLGEAQEKSRAQRKDIELKNGLISHLKKTNKDLARTMAAGFKSLIEHPFFSDIAIALTDRNHEVYLSPVQSTRFFGQRLKGLNLEKIGINFNELNEFQHVKINGHSYIAHVEEFDLRTTKNYFVVFTKPSFGDKAKEAVRITGEKAYDILKACMDAARRAEDYVSRRISGQKPGEISS